MSVQALATAAENKIPMVVVVWQDNHYGLIKWKQEMHFHQSSHTELLNHNLAQLAQAVGCHAKTIQSTEEFKTVLSHALTEQSKPTVIVVPVDYSENMKLFEHLKNVAK